MHPRAIIAALLGAVVTAACSGPRFVTDNSDGGATGGSAGYGGTGGNSASGGSAPGGGSGGTIATGGSGGGSGGSTGYCGDGFCMAPESCLNCSDCGLCGNGGSSGVGGAGGSGSCSDPDGLNPSVRATASGLNGTFSDVCDPSGNLIEYVCEIIFEPGCLPNPDPSCTRVTGNVVAANLDCKGTCVEGSCSGRCPQQEDRITYIERLGEGGAVFKNENDGHIYTCNLIFDNSSDTYNCTTDPQVSETVRVASLGLDNYTFCAPGPIGNIGTGQIGGAQQCTYACTLN